MTDRKGLGLIIVGGLLVGIGLGFVQAGLRASRPCGGKHPCEESPEDSAKLIAEASAEEEQKRDD